MSARPIDSKFNPAVAIESTRKRNQQTKRVTIHGREYLIYPEVFDGSMTGGELLYNFLVDNLVAIAHMKMESGKQLKFLEVGAGMGYTAIEFALRYPNSLVWATDISQVAVANAAENAKLHGVDNRVQAVQADVFKAKAIEGMKFDMIFFRPPAGYRDDLDAEDLEMFDRSYWDPCYNAIQRYFAEAREYLAEDGKLLFTTPLKDNGWGVAKDVLMKMVKEAGWEPIVQATIDPGDDAISAGLILYELVSNT